MSGGGGMGAAAKTMMEPIGGPGGGVRNATSAPRFRRFSSSGAALWDKLPTVAVRWEGPRERRTKVAQDGAEENESIAARTSLPRRSWSRRGLSGKWSRRRLEGERGDAIGGRERRANGGFAGVLGGLASGSS